jgi:hypothetical protein
MTSSRIGAAVVGALLSAMAVAAPSARAADADASAVERVPQSAAAYVAGSSQFSNDPRSGVLGRWNLDTGAFDWLERVDAAPGMPDAFSDVVPAGGFVYGVGYANGRLGIAKADPATGTLQRSCGPAGIALDELGASVLPGKAVAMGSDLVVVGATLAKPTRGMIAVIDGGDCSVRRSALVGGSDASPNVGFTSVDLDAQGNPVVSGFSGAHAAIFRFGADLTPLRTQTFDLGAIGAEAFTDLRTGSAGGVALGLVGTRLLAQCFTLPDLGADTSCGTAGRRSLSFSARGVPTGGAVLGRLRSGWLVAGSHLGRAGYSTPLARAALGAFKAPDLSADAGVFSPAGAQVFDPVPSTPSAFTAVMSPASSIVAVGVSGYLGSRRPFVFTAQADGRAATFTPLAGFDTAAAAPVEPEPAAPGPSPPGPASPGGAAVHPRGLATWRFRRMVARPAADGTFGYLALSCAHACEVSGAYTAPVRGGRTARLGATRARLAGGDALRVRLALTSAGRRTLRCGRHLAVTVRFAVTGRGAARQVIEKAVVLRA